MRGLSICSLQFAICNLQFMSSLSTPNVNSPWTPLAVEELTAVLRGAGFFWCLAGGHAIERVVGHSYRAHEDIDIVVLRSQQLAVQRWFGEWTLMAADPPGCLRPWEVGEKLTWRVHDIWAHRAKAAGWELQIMIQEDDGTSWFFRRDDRVHGRVDELAVQVDGIPVLRPALQLLFKAKSSRPRDELDFNELLPVLSEPERRALWEWLDLTSPNGHPWMVALDEASAK
jgi:hypothetical protein